MQLLWIILGTSKRNKHTIVQSVKSVENSNITNLFVEQTRVQQIQGMHSWSSSEEEGNES